MSSGENYRTWYDDSYTNSIHPTYIPQKTRKKILCGKVILLEVRINMEKETLESHFFLFVANRAWFWFQDSFNFITHLSSTKNENIKLEYADLKTRVDEVGKEKFCTWFYLKIMDLSRLWARHWILMSLHTVLVQLIAIINNNKTDTNWVEMCYANIKNCSWASGKKRYVCQGNGKSA